MPRPPRARGGSAQASTPWVTTEVTAQVHPELTCVKHELLVPDLTGNSAPSCYVFLQSAHCQACMYPELIIFPPPSCASRSAVSDSLRPHEPQPVRLLYSWDSSGKNTGVDCCSLLQRIFLTQRSNPGLLHCRQSLPSELQGRPFLLHDNVF